MRKTKELTEAELQELQFKRDWCLTIGEFIKKFDPSPDLMFYQCNKDQIEAALREKALRAMRRLYDEDNNDAIAFLEEDFQELNKILYERFGKDLTSVFPEQTARIERISMDDKYLIKKIVHRSLMFFPIRKKALNDQELQELKFKRDWIITLLEFGKKCDQDPEPDKYSWDWLIEITEQTFERKDLSGMRMVYNDDNEMAQGLKRSEIEELNAILREKFGEDLTTVNKRIAARIQKIEERGYIKTEGEWRMVRDWIDHIIWDDAKDEEVELLDRLMAEYDQSIEKKRAAKKQKKDNSTKS